MRSMRRAAPFAPLLLVLGCGVPEGPLCSGDDLQSALDAAGAGDVVEVGACSVPVALRVPAGVTLSGTTPMSALTAVEPTRPIVRLETSASAPPTVLRGLGLEIGADVGVRVTGDGSARVEDVSATAERGLAVFATGASVALSRVELVGPVTSANAFEDRFTTGDGGPPGYADTATHGVAIVGAPEATLTDVTVRGFAAFGAVFVDVGAATWTGGAVREVLGTGIFAFRAELTLTDVAVCDTLREGRAFDSYGVLAVDTGDGRMLASEGLRVEQTDGIGIAQVGVSAVHSGLTASGNNIGAVVADGGRSFELSGTGNVLSDNGLAGLLLTGLRDVIVTGARIEGTRGRVAAGGSATDPIGDGIQLNASTRNVVIDSVELSNNARVGLLADLGPTDGEGMTFMAVDVARGDGMLGAQAARPSGGAEDAVDVVDVAGWDEGVVRDPATVTADASFTGTLGTASTLLEGLDAEGIAAGMGLPL